MKSLPSALAAHIASRSTTLAAALRITRTDGQVFGFTSHDQDARIGGVPYLANPGLQITDIVIAANGAVGNLELTTLHDGSVFTLADVLGGKWRNAAFLIFRYNWQSPGDGIDILLAGTVGEFQLLQNTIIAELRDLRQYLQQGIGDASSKNCRARLGDARCRKSLGGFTYRGAITGVSSGSVFSASDRTEPLGWFDEGQITFNSGANIGFVAKIKVFSGGSFTLTQATPLPLAIGDTYTAIAGCRKRFTEDCQAKFDNVLNFVGEPHRKGLNDLTKPAAAA